MYGSSSSLMSQNNNLPIKPTELNKFNIRTKLPQFSIQIPFLNNQEKNVYIETFTVLDTNYTLPNQLSFGDQFLLYCDNAKGFYRANGKQTLLCAIANWDGDSNKLVFSMLNSNPFQIQKNDNLLNFVITKSSHQQDLYPEEQEGQQIQLNNSQYLFNIVLNVLSDDI